MTRPHDPLRYGPIFSTLSRSVSPCMVLPMPGGMGAAMQGDAPEQIYGHLHHIRWTVFGVFACSIGMIVYGSIPFNNLFYCIAATFLLKEDEWTGRGYKCLMASPLGACAGPTGGGLSCLSPVMFLAGINVLFGLFGSFDPFSLISLVCQGYGGFKAYESFKYLRGEAGATGALPGTVYNPPVREMNNDSAPGGGGQPQTSFVAFAGEGNKLGS